MSKVERSIKFNCQMHSIGNERGVITLDFIFALGVSFGFAILFFALALTLSMVEVGQYVAYATSRAHAGAHASPEMQRSLGEAKFAELMATPVFKTFFDGHWFQLDGPVIDNFTSEYPSDPAEDNDIFVGARIRFRAKILDLQIPFLGRTVTDPQTGSASLNAYLIREVTTQECRENFARQRFNRLVQIEFGGAQPYIKALPQNAFLITDNGC